MGSRGTALYRANGRVRSWQLRARAKDRSGLGSCKSGLQIPSAAVPAMFCEAMSDLIQAKHPPHMQRSLCSGRPIALVPVRSGWLLAACSSAAEALWEGEREPWHLGMSWRRPVTRSQLRPVDVSRAFSHSPPPSRPSRQAGAMAAADEHVCVLAV